MGQKGSRAEREPDVPGQFVRRAPTRATKGKMKKGDIHLEDTNTIHPMEATLPMPTEDEVNEKFTKMVVSSVRVWCKTLEGALNVAKQWCLRKREVWGGRHDTRRVAGMGVRQPYVRQLGWLSHGGSNG